MYAKIRHCVTSFVVTTSLALLGCNYSWADQLCGPTESQFVDELTAGMEQFAAKVTKTGSFATKEEYPGDGTAFRIISFVDRGKTLFTHRVQLTALTLDTTIRPTKAKNGQPGFSITLRQGSIGTCEYRVALLDSQFVITGDHYTGRYQTKPVSGNVDTVVDSVSATQVSDSKGTPGHGGGIAEEELPKPEQEETLNGVWEGMVQQGGATYPVTITVRASQINTTSGSIDYPGLGCGGSITLTKISNKTYLYRESIERGRDKCIDGGLLSLASTSNGTVDWKYRAPNNPSQVLATSNLRRTAARVEEGSTGSRGESLKIIPQKIKSFLDQKYPGWIFAPTSGVDIECYDIETKRQPSLALGDFNGDGKTDFAVQIVQKRTLYLFEFLSQDTGFVPHVLYKVPGSKRSGVLITALKGKPTSIGFVYQVDVLFVDECDSIPQLFVVRNGKVKDESPRD